MLATLEDRLASPFQARVLGQAVEIVRLDGERSSERSGGGSAQGKAAVYSSFGRPGSGGERDENGQLAGGLSVLAGEAKMSGKRFLVVIETQRREGVSLRFSVPARITQG